MKLSNVVGAVKEAVKPVLSLTDGFRLPRSISKPKPQVFPAGEGLFSQAPFKNPIASAIGRAEGEAAALEARPLTQKLQSFPEAYAAGQPTKTALFKQGLAQQVDKGIEQHPEAQVALEENITAMGMGSVGELRSVAEGATTLLGKAAKKIPEYFHGTSLESKLSMLEHGFNPALSKRVAEQPAALYGSSAIEEALMYAKDGEGAVVGFRPKPGMKPRILSSSSPEWAQTMGTSKSSQETAKWIEKMKKKYDLVDYGDEVEVLNPGKYEFFDPQQPKKVTKEAPVFEGFKDLSLKTLEKLKGRSTVDKQFIQDLTNQADLKQPEREVLREVLDTVKGKTVKVKEFAERVKTELLPLKRQIGTSGAETVQYEQINLPDELRGAVQDYHEVIYESPIKNTAGDTHFSSGGESMSDSYFGHVRTEDLPDQALYDRMSKIAPDTYPNMKREPATGSTRRVLELQSDLYQKGVLDYELQKQAEGIENLSRSVNGEMLSPRQEAIMKMTNEKAPIKTSKLQQYNDPTAHFRMIREEVKRAAQDGKTKLQFPTGDTAMKVEGLGDSGAWFGIGATSRQPVIVEPQHLKVGTTIYHNDRNYAGDIETLTQDAWVVTDVLEDGKFKAVPKDLWERANQKVEATELLTKDQVAQHKAIAQQALRGRTEQFDISGSVDKNNPIYKFYEKDVAKYLKNKYGAKLVTDPQGVTWMEVDIKPEHGKSPVEAFSFIPLLGGSYLQKMIEDGKEEPKPVLPRRIKGEPVLR